MPRQDANRRDGVRKLTAASRSRSHEGDGEASLAEGRPGDGGGIRAVVGGEGCGETGFDGQQEVREYLICRQDVNNTVTRRLAICQWQATV